MDESALTKIALGLLIPAILGLVKLYTDHAVLRSKHGALQEELNETKREYKSDLSSLRTEISRDNGRMTDMFDKRFEKLEVLIERYFTWSRENEK